MNADAKQQIAAREQQEIAAHVGESGSIMEVIARIAQDPNADVEKFERLVALHERMEEKRAERAFAEAMRAAQAEMPQVIRDARNDQTSSSYARLETVSKAMNPVIVRHGFSMSFGTEDSHLEGHYRVVCTVMHEAGHSRTYHADIPADLTGMKGSQNKTKTHAFGSTMSYGRRYLKMLVFDVATTDDDGNGAGAGDSLSDEQLAELRKLCKDFDANEQKVASVARVETLEEIPAAKFARVKQALNDWARAQRRS